MLVNAKDMHKTSSLQMHNIMMEVVTFRPSWAGNMFPC